MRMVVFVLGLCLIVVFRLLETGLSDIALTIAVALLVLDLAWAHRAPEQAETPAPVKPESESHDQVPVPESVKRRAEDVKRRLRAGLGESGSRVP